MTGRFLFALEPGSTSCTYHLGSQHAMKCDITCKGGIVAPILVCDGRPLAYMREIGETYGIQRSKEL